MTLNILLDPTKLTAEEVAVFLLLTSDRETEQEIKQNIEKTGLFKCAVTEIGSSVETCRKKIVSAVIGASLDYGLISKTPHQIHALVHAAEEAIKSILVSNPLMGDMGLKLSIVRDSQWIVVAVFGNCAAHYLSNHKHLGLGVMHIAY